MSAGNDKVQEGTSDTLMLLLYTTINTVPVRTPAILDTRVEFATISDSPADIRKCFEYIRV